MRVLGDGELPRRRGRQDVTMPGRHREPTFRIQTERRSTLKHVEKSLKNHFSPLNCTFSHCITNLHAVKRLFVFFFNEIKDLAHIFKSPWHKKP
jgi:hypothetical protein